MFFIFLFNHAWISFDTASSMLPMRPLSRLRANVFQNVKSDESLALNITLTRGFLSA